VDVVVIHSQVFHLRSYCMLQILTSLLFQLKERLGLVHLLVPSMGYSRKTPVAVCYTAPGLAMTLPAKVMSQPFSFVAEKMRAEYAGLI
jgi:hypothetical protein